MAQGLLQAVVVEDIGQIGGWLVGELYFKILQVQGNDVLVEFGLKDPENKRPLAKQEPVWVSIGRSVECYNGRDEKAMYVAQHIRIHQ